MAQKTSLSSKRDQISNDALSLLGVVQEAPLTNLRYSPSHITNLFFRTRLKKQIILCITWHALIGICENINILQNSTLLKYFLVRATVSIVSCIDNLYLTNCSIVVCSLLYFFNIRLHASLYIAFFAMQQNHCGTSKSIIRHASARHVFSAPRNITVGMLSQMILTLQVFLYFSAK